MTDPSPTQVLQIVPRLPPQICGVGDYATHLAVEWRKQPGLRAMFASADAGAQPEDPDARCFSDRGADAFLPFCSPAPSGIVLHYSGYGFARRGAPLWLPRALRRLKEAAPRARLLTVFHELYASGPVTSSAWWLQPFQKLAAARIAALSDELQTSCEVMRDVFHRLPGCDSRDIRLAAIFSNFGEPLQTIPLGERERNLVMFTSNAAAVDKKRLWEQISVALKVHQIDKLTLIGRHLEVPAEIPAVVDAKGLLPAGEVEEVLRRSTFGYVALSPYLLGKSGIFAAFAAHGLVPLIPTGEDRLPDGFQQGRHFLAAGGAAVSGRELMAISVSLHTWYQSHRISTTAADMLNRLGLQR